MTTTLEKSDKAVPWNDYLLPTLREPDEAMGYLQACLEENYPGVLCRGLCNVIEANKDLPFVAYLAVCSYSQYLTAQDIPRIIDTLKKVIDDLHQVYLSDLYWWLQILGERLEHSDSQVNVRVELEPRNLPDNIKALPEYQQWAAVA